MEHPFQNKSNNDAVPKSLVPFTSAHPQVHSSVSGLFDIPTAVGGLHVVLEGIKTQHSLIKQQLADANSTKDSLAQQLQVAQREAAQLHHSYQQAAEAHLRASWNLDRAHAALETASRDRLRLESALAQKQRHLEMVEETGCQLREELGGLREKAELAKQIPSLQQQLADAEASISALQQDIIEAPRAPSPSPSFSFAAAGWMRKDAVKLDAELERLKEANQSLTTQLASSTAQQRETSQKLGRAKATVEAAKAHVKDLEADYSSLQSRYGQLESARNEEHQKWLAEEAELKRLLEDTQSRLAEETAQKRSSAFECERLAKELFSVNQQLDTMSTQKAELENKVAQLHGDLEKRVLSHEQDKAAFEAQKKEYEEMHETLFSTVESEKSQLQQSQGEIEILKQQLEDSNCAIQNGEREGTRLVEQVAKETEAKAQVERELEASQKKLKEVTAACQSLEEAAGSKNADLECLQKEYEAEKGLRQQAIMQLEQTKTELDSLKKRSMEHLSQTRTAPSAAFAAGKSSAPGPTKSPTASTPNAISPKASKGTQRSTDKPRGMTRPVTQVSTSPTSARTQPVTRPNPSPSTQRPSSSTGRLTLQPKLDRQRQASDSTQSPEVIVVPDSDDELASFGKNDQNSSSSPESRRAIQTARKGNGGLKPKKPHLGTSSTQPVGALLANKRKSIAGVSGPRKAKKVRVRESE